jgi:hypothetical protein
MLHADRQTTYVIVRTLPTQSRRKQRGDISRGWLRHSLQAHQWLVYNSSALGPATMANTVLLLSMPAVARLWKRAIAAGGR